MSVVKVHPVNEPLSDLQVSRGYPYARILQTRGDKVVEKSLKVKIISLHLPTSKSKPTLYSTDEA